MAPKSSSSSSRSRDVNLLTAEYIPSQNVNRATGAPISSKLIKLNPNNPMASLQGLQALSLIHI